MAMSSQSADVPAGSLPLLELCPHLPVPEVTHVTQGALLSSVGLRVSMSVYYDDIDYLYAAVTSVCSVSKLRKSYWSTQSGLRGCRFKFAVTGLLLLLAARVHQAESLSYENRLNSFDMDGFGTFPPLDDGSFQQLSQERREEWAASGYWRRRGRTSPEDVACLACERSPQSGHAADCAYRQLLDALDGRHAHADNSTMTTCPTPKEWRGLRRWLLTECPALAESFGYSAEAVALAACRVFCRQGRPPQEIRAGDILEEIHACCGGGDSAAHGIDVFKLLCVFGD